MTTKDLEQLTAAPAARMADVISQATAVEQARAVAEVQAAVIVAQQVPRDMGRAVADMRDACGRLRLAERAFYTVPNRGTNKPSVHLARELARIFGNTQYGVHELRRDDTAEISEIQAFAWDVERNTRSTRTFIVPHARMVKPKGAAKAHRDPLTDLGDIYLNNQNVGARAVRECIFTILPTWFTDEAEDLCHKTMRDGEGVPLATRIDNAIGKFRSIEVTVDQLETKVGRKRGSWTPGDLAQLTIVWTSIERGEVIKDEEFPRHRETAAEAIAAEIETPPNEPAAEPWPEVAQPGSKGPQDRPR
jgi:hypothetical protein